MMPTITQRIIIVFALYSVNVMTQLISVITNIVIMYFESNNILSSFILLEESLSNYSLEPSFIGKLFQNIYFPKLSIF